MLTHENVNEYFPKSKAYFKDFIIFNLDELANSDAPNKYENPHKRSFFELSISKKEDSIISIGDTKITDIQNLLLFFSPMQIVSTELVFPTSKTDNEAFIIAFEPSFFMQEKRYFEVFNEFSFFNIHTPPHYSLSEQDTEELMQMASEMHQEYHRNDAESRNILKLQLELLLHKIKRLIKNKDNRIISNPYESICAKFENNILEDQVRHANIEHYASKMNISPIYLSECVKKATGYSAKQILLHHRLTVAKSLLIQSDKSITQISDEMNFSEVTNFIKFFKKMTGTTPKKFRTSKNL